MDLINIAVDPVKELAGARIKVDDKTTLIVARYNNPAFRKLQAKLMEPYIRKGGEADTSTEEAEEILSKCMAETILLGWENLYLEGELVEYSKEKALELFMDPRLIDFKEIVMLHSQTQANYRLASLKDDLGNSESSSITPPDGQRNGRSSSKKSKKKIQAARRQQAGRA